MGDRKVLVTGGTGFIGAAVVRNLLDRRVPVVIGELNPDKRALAKLEGAALEPMDVADAQSVESVFARHGDLTHCIHLAYLMSAEVEADMALGVKVNLLGMSTCSRPSRATSWRVSCSRAARPCL